MQATLPTRRSAPVVTLGRIRSWLVLASAGVIVAISELLGTLGSEPVDALRMTVSFVLVAGAAALYGLAVRWVFDQGTGQVREYFEANLASSKDTFIANVSHGLRTPLTGVVGFSHLLKSADLGPEDQESVKMIIAESAHPRPDATSSSLPIFRSCRPDSPTGAACPIARNTRKRATMSILSRKKTDCETHDWSSMVTAGLRRSVCRDCGTITLEAVSQDLSISATLREAAAAAR